MLRGDIMAGIIPVEEMKRIQKRMSKLMDDLGLTDLESKYMEEMQRIQKRMSEIMEEYGTSQARPDTLIPLADVRETDDSVVVTMDLPGIDKKDVEILVTEDEVNVKATRSSETKVDEKEYHKRERTCIRFERMVKLPVLVKSGEAKAKLNDGVLEVTLPKEVVTARRRISID
jgi:HSP20 family protein